MCGILELILDMMNIKVCIFSIHQNNYFPKFHHKLICFQERYSTSLDLSWVLVVIALFDKPYILILINFFLVRGSNEEADFNALLAMASMVEEIEEEVEEMQEEEAEGENI